MKIKVTPLIVSSLLSLTLFGGTAVAETADGFTPAEETICDALKEDGVTKGLYGLCVAFCEAQDIADESVPITEEDLLALEDEDNAPSGRILANYNKKKADTDPSMPCIVVEEPCPCFSAEELARIDGLIEAADAYSHTAVAGTISAIHIDQNQVIVQQAYVTNLTSAGGTSSRDMCGFRDDVARPRIYRHLSTKAGTLTHDKLLICDSMLRQSIADHGH